MVWTKGETLVVRRRASLSPVGEQWQSLWIVYVLSSSKAAARLFIETTTRRGFRSAEWVSIWLRLLGRQ